MQLTKVRRKGFASAVSDDRHGGQEQVVTRNARMQSLAHDLTGNVQSNISNAIKPVYFTQIRVKGINI